MEREFGRIEIQSSDRAATKPLLLHTNKNVMNPAAPQALGDEEGSYDEDGMHPSNKKSERKRQREKDRRKEMAEGFVELGQLLAQIDPDDSDGARGKRVRRGLDDGGTDTDPSGMTRIDLISRAIETIRKLHAENQDLKRGKNPGADEKPSTGTTAPPDHSTAPAAPAPNPPPPYYSHYYPPHTAPIDVRAPPRGPPIYYAPIHPNDQSRGGPPPHAAYYPPPPWGSIPPPPHYGGQSTGGSGAETNSPGSSNAGGAPSTAPPHHHYGHYAIYQPHPAVPGPGMPPHYPPPAVQQPQPQPPATTTQGAPSDNTARSPSSPSRNQT